MCAAACAYVHAYRTSSASLQDVMLFWVVNMRRLLTLARGSVSVAWLSAGAACWQSVISLKECVQDPAACRALLPGLRADCASPLSRLGAQ